MSIPTKPLHPLAKHPIPAVLLAISLACNIAALLLPFMTLRKGLDNEAYTLFHSITLLWGKGLYVLSLLVIGFSILFPFAKLGVLFWTVSSKNVGRPQRIWLSRVERLGKWSMLDVFLVSIILSLASQQFLVGAKPQLGLSLFICAILLCMTAGELMSRAFSKQHNAPPEPTQRSGGFILLLSGATLVAAIFFPFLRIEDWLLKNREYSIITLVPALWIQDAWLASLLTAAFLVVVPLLGWSADLRAWREPTDSPRFTYWAQLAQRWSMLDVFGLALLVFAIESDELMKTEIHWGALFLGATLVLRMALTSVSAKRSVSST